MAIDSADSICLVALCVALVLRLGNSWSILLMREAIAVYGSRARCPRMRCAQAWFVIWFVGCVGVLSVLLPGSPLILMVWVLWLALLGLAGLIDARTGLLPNELTLAVLLSGLVWHSEPDTWLPSASFAWGAVIGWLAPSLINKLHEHWRGTLAIGQGDARLLAGIGVWLGLEALPLVWVVACVAVLVYTALVWVAGHGRTSHVTFGPFLAMGASFVMMLNHV